MCSPVCRCGTILWMNHKNKRRKFKANAGAYTGSFFWFLNILLMLSTAFPYQAEPEITVEGIQKRYEGIRDIKGGFVQKSEIRDLKRTDTFRGRFLIKLPGKMKWQYTGDNRQEAEVIIRGEEILIYQKREKQAFRGRFNRETYGQAPIALLGGLVNIEKEFDASLKDGKIVLKPRRPMGAILSIEITPSEGNFPIEALSIVDRHSNRIAITLRNVVINSGVEDSSFDLILPRDVNVYEYNQPE
jgi:outer membrane lipoprotein-sorting protein